jgi:hypothetical protein
MTASVAPIATTVRLHGRARQGRRQAAKTSAALAIRSHATPGGSMRAKRSTAKAGPR